MAITDNLAWYYKFDWNSTASVWWINWTDTSVTYVWWKIGNAANLTTTASKIGLNSSFWITTTGDSTVSWWYYFTNLPASWQYYYVFSIREDTTDTDIELVFDYVAGVRMSAGKWKTNVNNAPSTLSHWITTWNWYHIVITLSNSFSTVYINWVSNYTWTNSWNWASYTWWNNTTIWWPRWVITPNFIVDEFGIWNRVLTTTEITQLYNSWNGLSYPFTWTTNSNFFMFF